MRAAMPRFTGTIIVCLISTYLWRLGRCYTILWLSHISFHASCILIVLQLPSEIFFRLYIPQRHCWKTPHVESCSIHRVLRISKYCWCARFDEPLKNGHTYITTSLIHCGGQRRFQVIHDQRIWGGLFPNFLFTVTWEKKIWCRIEPCPSHFLSFFWSGLQGPKAYSLWGGVVPSPSIGYEYL